MGLLQTSSYGSLEVADYRRIWSPGGESGSNKLDSTATTSIGSSGALKKAAEKSLCGVQATARAPMSRRPDSMRAPGCTNMAAATMRFQMELLSFLISPTSVFIVKNAALNRSH